MLGIYMKELGQGNTSALENIYKLTDKAVFSVCFSLLRDYALAEDIMQDTYIRILKNINHYKEQSKPLAWILTIAKNTCINELKRRKRESVNVNEIRLPSDNDIKMFDESGIINLTIHHLNKNESRIVLMHTLGDISLKDIAKILNKSQGTIRWQYNNALSKLRKIIIKEGQSCEK